MTKVDKELYISRQDLKSQGFTDSLLKKIEPDIINTWGSNKVTYYYLFTKIDEFKLSSIYQKFIVGADKRKERAQKSVQTKIKNIQEKINGFEIEVVPGYTSLQIKKMAIDSYNDFSVQRQKYNIVSYSENNKEFTDRLCVNFIRHNLTNYESVLSYLESKVGKTEAYILLKEKVFDKIAVVYPAFAQGCIKQKLG